MSEMPTLMNYAVKNTCYGLGSDVTDFAFRPSSTTYDHYEKAQLAAAQTQAFMGREPEPKITPKQKEKTMTTKRIVRVFVVDADENLSLEDAVLHWYPASNQIMGVVLCNRAADMFGENPNDEPWN